MFFHHSLLCFLFATLAKSIAFWAYHQSVCAALSVLLTDCWFASGRPEISQNFFLKVVCLLWSQRGTRSISKLFVQVAILTRCRYKMSYGHHYGQMIW